MNEFFNVDNKFFSAMGKVADMLLINVAFLLTVLIGIGPACTALYYAVMKNVRKGRGYALRTYFYSFAQNFKQGFACGVIQLVFALMCVWCYQFAMAMDPGSTFGQVYYAGIFVIIFLFASLSIFIYPILSRFTLKTGALIKMSFVLSLRNLIYTLPLLILLIAGIAAVWVTYGMAILFVPVLYTFLSTFLLEKVFRKYMVAPTGEEAESIDAWWLD